MVEKIESPLRDQYKYYIINLMFFPLLKILLVLFYLFNYNCVSVMLSSKVSLVRIIKRYHSRRSPSS